MFVWHNQVNVCSGNVLESAWPHQAATVDIVLEGNECVSLLNALLKNKLALACENGAMPSCPHVGPLVFEKAIPDEPSVCSAHTQSRSARAVPCCSLVFALHFQKKACYPGQLVSQKPPEATCPFYVLLAPSVMAPCNGAACRGSAWPKCLTCPAFAFVILYACM